jgi:hypothetical protein
MTQCIVCGENTNGREYCQDCLNLSDYDRFKLKSLISNMGNTGCAIEDFDEF